MEKLLESERSKALRVEEELEMARSEFEVVRRNGEAAKTLAAHISDTWQLVVNSDPTQSETVTCDLTQSGAATSSSADWNVVRSQFDDVVGHFRRLLADSECSRLEAIDENSRQMDTLRRNKESEVNMLRRNHDAEVAEAKREGEETVEALTAKFEAEMGDVRTQWRTEVDELRTANQALVADLGRKHSEEVEELEQRHRQEIVECQNRSEQELEQLREADVEELRGAKEAAQSEIGDLKEKWRRELEAASQQRQDELDQSRERVCNYVYCILSFLITSFIWCGSNKTHNNYTGWRRINRTIQPFSGVYKNLHYGRNKTHNNFTGSHRINRSIQPFNGVHNNLHL